MISLWTIDKTSWYPGQSHSPQRSPQRTARPISEPTTVYAYASTLIVYGAFLSRPSTLYIHEIILIYPSQIRMIPSSVVLPILPGTVDAKARICRLRRGRKSIGLLFVTWSRLILASAFGSRGENGRRDGGGSIFRSLD